jgi:hypothetical protein
MASNGKDLIPKVVRLQGTEIFPIGERGTDMNATTWSSVLFATAIIAALAGFSPAPFAAADPPGRVNFQGMARDAGGTVLDGPVAMIFRFYDDPAAGTILWEEVYDPIVYPPAVAVSDGLFTVALGDSTHKSGGGETTFQGVFANHAAVYLGVRVGLDTEMTPRISVVSTPFAVNSGALEGKGADDFAGAVHTHLGSQITGAVANAADAANADKLDNLDSTAFAASSHNHATSDLTSGTLAVGRGGTGLSSPGTDGNVLTSDGAGWTSSAAPSAASTGGVTDAANATLTRSGSGTGASPFKLALNLGNANTWSGGQTFSANTSFPGSGIWTSSGKVGIGTVTPDANFVLDVRSSALPDGKAIHGIGPLAGGYFASSDGSGLANIGLRQGGVSATGTAMGGYFIDQDNSGYAYVGYGDQGIHALGNEAGGYFKDKYGSGFTYAGIDENGLWAMGNECGGSFNDANSSVWAAVANSTFKINSNGTVNFVQNHPLEKDKVIVYASPEGDEVATYTRGTARLANGEARVRLGETFQWVTNPDIGLTVHLTPRGKCRGLYVDSLSTTELVVREQEDGTSDAAFDYLVYGLRIGFEESSIVQEKQKESFIPSFKDHRDRYAKYPELRTFNALERFKTMESAMRGVGAEALDLSRARELKDAIHEYDPATDPPVHELFGYDPRPPSSRAEAGPATEKQVPESMPLARSTATPRSDVPSRKASDEEPQVPSASLPPSLVHERFPVCEPVEAGEVLVSSADHPGAFCLGRTASDPGVFGIVTGDPVPLASTATEHNETATRSFAAVALGGVAVCKVDASYGPISVNDLLATSPTVGHAMRATAHNPGTILGKALEPLDAGTGVIRILVMLR